MNSSSDDLLLETKTQVRCIIVSNPANMTVKSLIKDYSEMIGSPLPFSRLGFKRAIDFLQSIPDVVQVSGEHPQTATLTPVITKNLTNLNKLITKQRIEKPRRGQRQQRRQTKIICANQYNQNNLNKKHRHSNDYDISRKQMRCQNSNKSDAKRTSNQESYRKRTSQKFVEECWNPEITESKFVEPKLITNKSTNSKSVELEFITDKTTESKLVEPKLITDKITNSKLVEPKFISDEITDSKSVQQSLINHKITESKFVESNSPNCINDKITSSKFDDPDSPNPTSDQSSDSLFVEPYLPNVTRDKNSQFVEPDLPNLISDKIHIQIENLIKLCPEGLLIDSLAQQYEESFGEELNYDELGFTSALHFCLQLTDKLKIVHSEKLGNYYLFDATQKLSSYNENDILKQSTESETSLQKSNLHIPQCLLANDVIRKNDDIIPVTYKVNFYDGLKLKIVITEVYEPTRFWFLIDQEDLFPKLEKISKDMSALYKETQDKYMIPEQDIQPGIFCAACIDDNWNRAFIIGIINSSHVKVFFIDFGNIAVVDNSCIRYMTKNYQDFPRQAVRGRLDHILPKDKKGSWDPSISRYFFNIVREKLLLAHFTEIKYYVDTVDTWMVLKIYNKERNSDLTINEKLLSKGYAVLSPSAERIRNPFEFF